MLAEGGLEHKLLDWPLLQNIPIVIGLDNQSVETGLLWDALSYLVDQLVCHFRRRALKLLKVNGMRRLVVCLLVAKISEPLD